MWHMIAQSASADVRLGESSYEGDEVVDGVSRGASLLARLRLLAAPTASALSSLFVQVVSGARTVLRRGTVPEVGLSVLVE